MSLWMRHLVSIDVSRAKDRQQPRFDTNHGDDHENTHHESIHHDDHPCSSADCRGIGQCIHVAEDIMDGSFFQKNTKHQSHTSPTTNSLSCILGSLRLFGAATRRYSPTHHSASHGIGSSRRRTLVGRGNDCALGTHGSSQWSNESKLDR